MLAIEDLSSFHTLQTKVDYMSAFYACDTLFPTLLEKMGSEGRDFNASISKVSPSVTVSLGWNGIGRFSSFDENGFFQNRITYGIRAFTSFIDLFSVYVHEGTHAIQYASIPALRASIFNINSSFALCPRDIVFLVELLERDAYAKNAIFSRFLTEIYPSLSVEGSDAQIMSDLTKGKEDRILCDVFRETAQSALALNVESGLYKETSLSEFNHLNILSDIEQRIYLSLTDNNCLPNFVRITDKDLSYFSKVFGGRIEPVVFSDTVETRIKDINKWLGIEYEEELPTFSELVQLRGLPPLNREEIKNPLPVSTPML